MGNIWHDFTKWLEDASNVVGKEAGDLTLKGRLKLEIFELNRKLRDHYATLGKIAYDEFFVKKTENWHKRKNRRRRKIGNREVWIPAAIFFQGRRRCKKCFNGKRSEG